MEERGPWANLCQACEGIGDLNDLGLCPDCRAKLERDLIRQREWDHSVSGFALDEQERESLRKRVIRAYGKELELILGSSDEQLTQSASRKRRRGGRR